MLVSCFITFLLPKAEPNHDLSIPPFFTMLSALLPDFFFSSTNIFFFLPSVFSSVLLGTRSLVARALRAHVSFVRSLKLQTESERESWVFFSSSLLLCAIFLQIYSVSRAFIHEREEREHYQMCGRSRRRRLWDDKESEREMLNTQSRDKLWRLRRPGEAIFKIYLCSTHIVLSLLFCFVCS